MTKPVVLCILDGVGVARGGGRNAVAAAKMPFFRGLLAKYPNMELGASGESVGLPRGTMGNSEVGHITIGAGRVVDQFLLRFQKENLGRNRALEKFTRDAPSGVVHFVGLASDGKVHASLDDALAVARVVIRRGLKIVWHFIADGRDVDSKSALNFVRKIRRALGRDFIFGSLSGRYYAMDRNNNWDRTREAFAAIFGTAGVGRVSMKHALLRSGNMRAGLTIEQAIRQSYARGITDEFIRPVRFDAPPIGPRDGVLFFNYRSDRARQF
ncbi:MAG: 2,3-bisphosphoglycerate-independent phosphoglycerate mutase, partial [Rickettsiales bacterium]|nr:2,3-bisphosphoglycerate-independent phosphoglycerate mutase [Rickettsiales bacterium]